jgi:beta-glucosidase/6-phospho-beta-glucosidase/beta-galactosidase
LHIDRDLLDRELDGFSFPETFDFGASTSGYQVEGGFNGPDDPKNNWFGAEVRGEKACTGPCARFLENYGDALDRGAWIGLNAFRMGVEWARLQPATDPAATNPPPFSAAAARTYARIMAAAYDRGMFPAVTLHHFTNPLWAGLDLWLDWPKVREWFGAYVEFAVGAINDALVGEFGKPPIPFFLTINEPISSTMAGYLGGVFPTGGAKGLRPAMTCYENLLLAHVLAYRTIHRIYRERGWPRPTVTLNTWCAGIYGLDKIAPDLFLARANGAARADIPTYVADQRARFRAHVRRAPYVNGPRALKHVIDSVLDRLLQRGFRPEPFSRLADFIYEGDEPRLIDVLAFDYYDPFPADNIDFSFPRLVRIGAQPYDWHFHPGVLRLFLESYSWTAGDLPIHIVEHGICHRFADGRAWPHPDGVGRDGALKEFLLEMVRGIREGRRVHSFYYWSLLDNYEWGSFEPRFGLFGVDYDNDARLLPTDIAGANAAGAYRLFVEAFRARDAALLRDAFLADRYPPFPR